MVLALAAACSAAAAHGADQHHPHHLGLFAGLGSETKPGRPDEDGFALGLEYEYRFAKRWGIGGVVEFLGQDTFRNAIVVVPVSVHPIGGLRVFFGPGVEFTPKKDKLAWRLGLGYSFHFTEHWAIVPEILVDFIETGEDTWLAGVALGYAF